MGAAPRRIVPATPSGRICVGLACGLLALVAVLFVVSNAVTDGGSNGAPAWLQVLVVASVLVVAVPTVVLGFRAMRTDRSVLGTIALTLGWVVGGWTALTGLLHLFME